MKFFAIALIGLASSMRLRSRVTGDGDVLISRCQGDDQVAGDDDTTLTLKEISNCFIDAYGAENAKPIIDQLTPQWSNIAGSDGVATAAELDTFLGGGLAQLASHLKSRSWNM